MTQNPFGAPPPQQSGGNGAAPFDPLATQESTPAVTFADANGNDCPVGAVVSLEITEPGQQVQERDFDTKEPKFWSNKDGSQGNPRMAAVFTGEVVRDDVGRNTGGESENKRSLWASIPSNLLEALQKAQKEAGVQIGVGNGGILHVRYDGRGEHRSAARAHLPKPKTYTAVYQPHAAPDPMSQPQAQQPAQQVQPQAQPAAPPVAPQQAQQAAQQPQQSAPSGTSPWDAQPAAPAAGDPFAAAPPY